MDRLSKNQYDDLTVESDEYDEPFDDADFSGSEDLFDFSSAEEGDAGAVISRLKSLVLSIDWEITDEILESFTRELEALKGVWAGEKVNLIYVQALEKLSRYVYVEKGNAHPGALQLLFTLYQNLEKIVLETTWTEEQKKSLLREDVKRFALLKDQIEQGTAANTAGDEERSIPGEVEEIEGPPADEESVPLSAVEDEEDTFFSTAVEDHQPTDDTAMTLAAAEGTTKEWFEEDNELAADTPAEDWFEEDNELAADTPVDEWPEEDNELAADTPVEEWPEEDNELAADTPVEDRFEEDNELAADTPAEDWFEEDNELAADTPVDEWPEEDNELAADTPAEEWPEEDNELAADTPVEEWFEEDNELAADTPAEEWPEEDNELAADTPVEDRFEEDNELAADTPAEDWPEEDNELVAGERTEEEGLAALQLCLQELEQGKKSVDFSVFQQKFSWLHTLFQGFSARQDLLNALEELSHYIWKTEQPHEETFRVVNALFTTLETLTRGTMIAEEETAEAFAVLERYQAVKLLIENDALSDIPVADKRDESRDSVGAMEMDPPEAEEEGFSFIVEPEEDDSEEFQEKQEFAFVPEAMALQGVDVDTEADDDSEEAVLPWQDGELAPALASVTWEERGEREEREEDSAIEETVSGFFEESGVSLLETTESETAGAGLALVDVAEETGLSDDFASPFAEAVEPEEEPLSAINQELQDISDDFQGHSGDGEEELSPVADDVAVASAEDADSFEERIGAIDAAMMLKDMALDDAESEDACADAALEMLEKREGEIAALFPDDCSGPKRESSQGVAAEEGLDDDALFAAAGDVAVADSPEEFSFLEEETTIDPAIALEGVDTGVDEGEPEEDDSLSTGVVAALGGLAGIETLAAASVASEIRADVEESVEEFFGSEENAGFAPIADSAAMREGDPGKGVVFTLAEDLSEAQEDVHLLCQYCDELVSGEQSGKMEDILRQHDRLVEALEGRPLELHFLLLFTAVADYLKGHQKCSDEPVALLRSISGTLREVLDQSESLMAQKMLLRESARVLEWQSGLMQ